jgi:hypothetical protein
MTPEERKAYHAIWYAKNKEKIAHQYKMRKAGLSPPPTQRGLLTEEDRREARKKYNREYREANRELLSAKRKVYRATHARPYIPVESSTPAYRERQKRKRKRWAERNPDKYKEKLRKAQIRHQFGGVVDVEMKKLLVVTKLLQLNIKKLLNHGETNEEHR